MTLYQELQAIDIVDPILGLFKEIPPNGKLALKSKIILPHPWIHSIMGHDRNCGKFTLYFNHYKIIPRECMACWKIAFSPKTLKEAFDLVDFQKDLGYYSKVGMEKRDYTQNKGGYSAFWYCPLGCGLERARELFKEIKGKVNEFLGRDTGIILKRGCTEFEKHFGASDGWDALARNNNWDMKQDLLDSVYQSDDFWRTGKYPGFVEINTMLHMIHWAYETRKLTGDDSYLEYIGEEPTPPLLTYQKSIHSGKDFPEVQDARFDIGQFAGTEEDEAQADDGESLPGSLITSL